MVWLVKTETITQGGTSTSSLPSSASPQQWLSSSASSCSSPSAQTDLLSAPDTSSPLSTSFLSLPLQSLSPSRPRRPPTGGPTSIRTAFPKTTTSLFTTDCLSQTQSSHLCSRWATWWWFTSALWDTSSTTTLWCPLCLIPPSLPIVSDDSHLLFPNHLYTQSQRLEATKVYL